MDTPEKGTGTHLEHLCEMALEYRQGMAPMAMSKGRIGEYMGSGEGSVFGPRINGVVSWDLFQEEDAAIRGANLRGNITTDDGAGVDFEALCLFLRPKHSMPTVWLTTACARFNSDSPIYRWMNDVLAVWQGTYDMGINRYNFTVFTQAYD